MSAINNNMEQTQEHTVRLKKQELDQFCKMHEQHLKNHITILHDKRMECLLFLDRSRQLHDSKCAQSPPVDKIEEFFEYQKREDLLIKRNELELFTMKQELELLTKKQTDL